MKYYLLTTLLSMLAATNPSQAAVTITFTELNGHVVATPSGSLVAESGSVSSMAYAGATLNTTNDNFFGVRDYLARGVFGNVENEMPDMLTGARFFSGDTFGFDDNGVLFYKESWAPGDVLTPVTSQWVWFSTNLAEVFGGAGEIPTSNTLVWSQSNGDHIYFAAVVPEPSTVTLCALGLSVIAFRRKR